MTLLRRLSTFLYPTTLTMATFEQLLNWQASLAHLDSGTVAGYVSSAHHFYRWLVKPMTLLDTSPAEDLVIPKTPRRKPRPVPEADYQYALAGCVDNTTRTWLYLTRYAGLRCVEIAGLKRDDVLDEPPPRLHVKGKGGHERIVYIPSSLVDILAPFMRRQGTLFTHEDGRPFLARTVSERIAKHFDRFGLPYTAHQLRHSYGTDSLRRSKNLRVVQQQMGHLSTETTQLYTEVNTTEAIDLAGSLDKDLREKRRQTGMER